MALQFVESHQGQSTDSLLWVLTMGLAARRHVLRAGWDAQAAHNPGSQARGVLGDLCGWHCDTAGGWREAPGAAGGGACQPDSGTAAKYAHG